MSAEEDPDQPVTVEPAESDRGEGEEDDVGSEELKLLRRKRGQKLAAFSRICHRADALIVGRGSRTKLGDMMETIDTALECVIAANDALEACLCQPKDKLDAEAYAAKVEAEREAITQRITQHLAERRDETPSVTGSRVSVAQQSRTSSTSRASQIEAEVSAKVKALRLQQVRRRQEQERVEEEKRRRQQEEERRCREEERRRQQEEERRRREEERRRQEEEKRQLQEKETERRQQLQEAEDEAEAARLEARLRKSLGDDLGYDRRNDFEDEQLGTEEIGTGDHDQEASENHGKQQAEAARDVEPRPARRAEEPVSSQVRDTAAWIRDLRSPQYAEQAERAPTCSAFAKSIPRLSLPTFSGKASDWPRWIGLFKALVHDQPSLSDTEKIAHLQSSVSGLAQQTISGMLYDGNLYHKALETLEERFGQDDDIIKFNLNSVFEAPDPLEDDADSLEKFQATVHCAVTILQNMGAVADLHSSDSLQRTVEKLPRELRREWGKFALELKPARPSLLDVDKWLRTQARISRICPKGKRSFEESSRKPRKERTEETARRRAFTTAANPAQVQKCSICEGQHSLEQCQRFLQMSPDARLKHVFTQQLCLHCLKRGHRVKDCRKAKPCGRDGCKYRHHVLLHGSQRVKSSDTRPTGETEANEDGMASGAEQPDGQERVVAAAAYQHKNEHVVTLLQVVPVRVHGKNGTRDTFALLDPGAQTSLCSNALADQLNIQGKSQELCVQTVQGSGKRQTARKMVMELSGLSADASKERITVPEVWAVPRLNISMPRVNKQDKKKWQHLNDLDVPDCASGEVELLLGANVIEAVIQHEVRTGAPGQPVAIKTDFGWALTGAVHNLAPEPGRQVMLIQRRATTEELLTDQVKDWWSTESFGTKYDKPVSQSKEDERALSILMRTTKQLPDRYETGMLWKEDHVEFPNNRGMAMKRLEATERSLKRRPELAEGYRATMQSYIQQGHARKLTPEEASQPSHRRWFLPHHAVTNPNKPGKVRVVFDAAAKFHGTSLNDKLMTGPDMLRSLPGVLLRFREEPIALTADIEQMYHQVRVTKEDQPALSFLWRDLDESKSPDVYQMQAVVFGAKSSPAMANFVLQRTAHDHREPTTEGEAAAAAVQSNFYMDDFLKSVETSEAAIAMQQETTKLLAAGGFRLTKWLSNSRKVLECIPASERAVGDVDLSLHSLPTERALGVIWNSENDTLSFRVATTEAQPTKREVLRQTASVFDPLGIGAPFIIRAKILMQHLWTLDLEWDECLAESENEQWKKWLGELRRLEEVSVPRCIKPGDKEATSSQFHVFCDASEAAFGAAIYLRTSLSDGSHHCALVISKTRVAPLKAISIVRLELQAAVLAARLMDTVRKEATVETDSVTFWTDSQVVLQYIQNESRRFHVFVANRVAEIQDLTEKGQWRHVPGSLNPADDCSRGLAASDLTPDCRWLRGPDFLWKDEEQWPPRPDTSPLRPDQEEVKEEKFTGLTIKVQPVLPDPARFSSWTKYRRVVAWSLRFLHNLAAKHVPGKASWSRSGPLTASEMIDAEQAILRREQADRYPTELGALKSGNHLPARSDLLSLAPYLDADGLLRVGGRLRHAPLPEAEKHPIILPRKAGVTRMIIADQHCRLLHAGVEHTLNELRRRFWIPQGRAEVKQNLHSCMVCRNRRVTPQPPKMAELPPARFDTSRPFSTVGIDYLGPLTVRKFRKTEKRYVLLVTCLATRAVHLEVANSLDTDSFLMALRRFMARRGQPKTILSDNGTNFVGGERELREAVRQLDQNKISNDLSPRHIDWHFLTPAASHMGGVWERLVGSVKRSLKVVLGNQVVSDEVLSSALCEVEHVINSRPLTYVSSDAADFRALTPNHLLLGDDTPHLPPGVFSVDDLSTRKKWRHAQALASHFWKRWSREYLPTLTQRKKWQKDTKNVEIGDLVLLADSNAPRGSWPLARVSQVFPGSDGRVRSVEIKTAGGGVYRRPVVKIAVLEGVRGGEQ